jgi:hypothetical protein
MHMPPVNDLRPQGEGESGDDSLATASTEALQLMRYTPLICTVIGILWILSAAFFNAIYTIVLVASSSEEGGPGTGVVVGLMLFGLCIGVAGVGMLLRAGWVRYPAMVLCALYLIGFPLGTILGVFGLLALVKGRRMFGRHRLTVAEVDAEILRRGGGVKHEQTRTTDGATHL